MLWLLSGVALLVAAAALVKGRRAMRRLERLSESYWELRYEQGQLSARVARLEGSPEGTSNHDSAGNAEKVAFVPLSSLRR
jgi:hypothetical protein